MTRLPFLRAISLFLLMLGAACGDDDGGGGDDPPTDAGPDAGDDICVDDSDCTNRVFCDGEERCRPGADSAGEFGCVPPADSTPCDATDRCDEDADACLPQCDVNPDFDGDGDWAIACDGGDCDDADPLRSSTNAEVCDAEGIDEDCRPETLGPDADGDSFISTECCNLQPSGTLRCGLDCNDDDEEINQRKPERCNDEDDNCNGAIDEGLDATYYPDCDGDLHGATGSTAVVDCAPPMDPPAECPGGSWVLNDDNDCDDTTTTVNPSAPETCDGLDNDCNGLLDGVDGDVDDDGRRFCEDPCPGDPNSQVPSCGCGEPSEDWDRDGTPRCVDRCPSDPNKVTPGICGCQKPEDDLDGDGVPDDRDLDGRIDCEGPLGALVVAGDHPGESELLDLDQDGIPDILSYSAGETAVRYGNGDSSFTEPWNTGLVGASAADVNGDGKLDLVGFANSGTSADMFVRLARASSFRSFEAPTLIGGALARARIFATDINHNGRDELFLIGSATQIEVFEVAPPSSLTHRGSYTTASRAESIAFGDVDGDGIDDVAGLFGTAFGIWFGRLDGSLEPITRIDLGANLRALASGDIDGDGVDELVIGDTSNNAVRIFGSAPGTRSLSQQDQLVDGIDPFHVAVSDLDLDGILDVVTRSDEGLAIRRGLGHGVFSDRDVLSDGPGWFRIGDIDSNGASDVLLTVPSESLFEPPSLGYRLNNSLGWFASSYPIDTVTSGGPVNVAEGDLDGDSIPDLLLSGATFRAPTVRFGLGNGDFLAPTFLPGTSSIRQTISIDINRDGLRDIAGITSNSIHLWIQSSARVFGPPSIVAAPSGTGGLSEVSSGHVDGDTIEDIVVTDPAANRALVYFPSSSAIGSPLIIPTGVRPDGVFVADINDDSHDDLVVGGFSGHEVRLSDGGGGLFPPTESGDPMPFALADLNNDGRNDLIGGGYTRLGLGGGLYDPPVEYFMSHGSSSALVRDLTGDGTPDLVTLRSVPALGCSSCSDVVALSPGDGAGGFGDPQALMSGSGFAEIATVDFNGDGSLDVVVTRRRLVGLEPVEAEILIALRLSEFEAIGLESSIGPRAMSLVRSAAPALPKLAIAAVGADELSVYSFSLGSAPTLTAFGVGSQPTDCIDGDFNSDGFPDMASTSEHGASVSVILGTGPVNFGPPRSSPAGALPQALAAGDTDGDGGLDLAVANELDGAVSLLRGAGDGTFTLATALPVGDAPFDVLLGDMDGDGDLDIVSADSGSDQLSLMLGGGDGSFAPAVQLPVGSVPKGIAAADLDGDGDLDLVSANEGSDDVSLLLGNGDGTFAAAVPIVLGPLVHEPQSVLLADEDGDGYLDIITANELSNDVAIRHGRGDGTFELPFRVPVGTAPQDVVAFDIDGDGRLDLVTANEGSNDLTIIRRR